MGEKPKFECKRCGLCCMTCDMHLDIIEPATESAVIDKLRWLNLHRCDTQIRTMKDGKRFSVLRIPLVCVMLDQDKDGKYKCKDYDHRPDVCRKFLCMKSKLEGEYTGMPDKT